MNKLTIIGNVTNDPEMRQTQSGVSVCSFTVAVNGRKRADGTHETQYFRVSAWRKLAETCTNFLSKGRKVCVVGPVNARAYQSNSGEIRASLEMNADDIEFLSSRSDSREQNNDNGNAEAVEHAAPAPVPVEDTDLPWE